MVKKKMPPKKHGLGKFCTLAGAGMIIFGLVLFYTNSWPYAFIVLGIISILKGLYLYSKGC